jgi:Cu-processing system permease protein
LVADKGATIGAGVVDVLLLLNPADAYRVLNLTSFGEVSRFAGMAGLSQQAGLGAGALVSALVAWVVLPLTGAAVLLQRRQL